MITDFKDTFSIDSGLINFDLLSIQKWALLQESGAYTITISQKRTIDQNKILHVLIKEFRVWMYESQGETWSPEVGKYMFKLWSGFYTEHLQKSLSGSVKKIKVPKESSKMSKKKFVAWMKYVNQKWYNDFGYTPKTLLDKETADFLGINWTVK